MMNINFETIILAVIASSLGTVVGWFLNKRTQDTQLKMQQDKSIIENTKQITEITSEFLDDFEKRWQKRLDEQQKEHGENMGRLRERLEDEARQSKGEMLVEIDLLKERNNQLKIQIAELGGFVQGATGDIYKRFPLERPKGE